MVRRSHLLQCGGPAASIWASINCSDSALVVLSSVIVHHNCKRPSTLRDRDAKGDGVMRTSMSGVAAAGGRCVDNVEQEESVGALHPIARVIDQLLRRVVDDLVIPAPPACHLSFR